MTTESQQQIAREAALELYGTSHGTGQLDRPISIILSAIDRATQPQRSEQKEWTPTKVKQFIGPALSTVSPTDSFDACYRLSCAINAALAAERQRAEKAEREATTIAENARQIHIQLLSAQAAIKALLRAIPNDERLADHVELFEALENEDFESLLHRHDAEVRHQGWDEGWDAGREHERKYSAEAREPLVSALRAIANSTNSRIANDALAKVKEGK